MASKQRGVPAAKASPVFSPEFKYHGGPIIANAKVGLIFVGQHPFEKEITQFVSDLGQSKFMNILSQYGVKSLVVASTKQVNAQPGNLTIKDIWNTVRDAAKTDTEANCFLLLLAPGIGTQDGSTVVCEKNGANAFGFHDYFYHLFHRFDYAVVPALTDDCLKESCPSDLACSLHLAQKQLDRITQVISHELAEMLTDPRLDAWTIPGFGENGDLCNGGNASLQVNGRTWNVQKTYSKRHDEQGQPYCQSENPSPLPAYSLSASIFSYHANFWTQVWHFFSNNLSALGL